MRINNTPRHVLFNVNVEIPHKLAVIRTRNWTNTRCLANWSGYCKSNSIFCSANLVISPNIAENIKHKTRDHRINCIPCSLPTKPNKNSKKAKNKNEYRIKWPAMAIIIISIAYNFSSANIFIYTHTFCCLHSAFSSVCSRKGCKMYDV